MDPTAVAARRLIVEIGVFSALVNILMLTGPLIMLQIYDRVLASRSEPTLVALVGIVTVLFLFMGLLDHARGRLMARVGATPFAHNAIPNRFPSPARRGHAIRWTTPKQTPGLRPSRSA